MKPKIFIGSSVEGLSVAYAIQQNLTHDAEATVWDQGVFALSKTTIESLSRALETVDFGIFVFSPDDEVLMRGSKSPAIRDNVLFELGLFIGKLGRERVFFIIPDGVDIHIPSDLLGVTPAKYNPKREDKSLQAATGPACNQIRNEIKQLGPLRQDLNNIQADQSETSVINSNYEWLTDLINKKFAEAKQKLHKVMEGQEGNDLLESQAWMAYIELKIDETVGLHNLCELAERYKDNGHIFRLILMLISRDNYDDLAISIGEKYLNDSVEGDQNAILLANLLNKIGEEGKAIDLLNKRSSKNNPNIAIALAEIYKQQNNIDEALKILDQAYKQNSNNEELIFKYARYLQDNDNHHEAVFLFQRLTSKSSEVVVNWGYFGNSCIQLELYDQAMSAYRKANELGKGKESWILHNIGNLLNARGFFSDAIESLSKGLELEPNSQYAHDRISTVIKNKQEELEKFEGICKEGRKRIRSKSQATDCLDTQ